MSKKATGCFFTLLFLFYVFFGYYYAFTESQKKRYFSPFDSNERYFQRQILHEWKTLVAEGDLQAYNRMAYSLAETGTIHNHDGTPSAWVTPGYPIFLALLYKSFGYSFHPIVFANALLLTFTVFFFFRASVLFFGLPVGLVTLLLLAVNVRTAMFVGYIYTECLFFFLMGITLYALAKLDKRSPIFGWILAACLAAGWAILTRPVAVAALPLVAALVWRRVSWRAMVAFTLVASLPLSIWLGRNYLVFGQPLLTTNSPYAMAEGNQDFYRQFSFWDAYRSSLQQKPYADLTVSHPIPEAEGGMQVAAAFKKWRAENRSFYTWLVAWRFKTFLSPYTADMSSRNKLICLAIWLLTFPPAFVTLAFFRPFRKTHALFFLGAIALLVIPSLAVVGNSLRYQIPAQLLLTPLAAVFWLGILRSLVQKMRLSIFFTKIFGEQSLSK